MFRSSNFFATLNKMIVARGKKALQKNHFFTSNYKKHYFLFDPHSKNERVQTS